jgi:hypothetical protein
VCPHFSRPSLPDATKKKGKPVFPLRRYLERVTSLHRNIDVLIRYAKSTNQCFHPTNFNLSVVTLPAPSCWLGLPDTKNAWRDSLMRAIKTAGYVVTREQTDKTVDRAVAKYTDFPRAPVLHCELALIAQYLAKSSKKKFAGTPEVCYIGLSKPCCRTCSLLISAVNETSEITFATRECNGKWYADWAFPETLQSFVTPLYRSVAESLAYALQCQGGARLRVDNRPFDSDGYAKSFYLDELDRFRQNLDDRR